MEIIIGIIAVAISCLVVFFVTKHHRMPEEEAQGDQQEDVAKKGKGKKKMAAKISGTRSSQVGDAIEKNEKKPSTSSENGTVPKQKTSAIPVPTVLPEKPVVPTAKPTNPAPEKERVQKPSVSEVEPVVVKDVAAPTVACDVLTSNNSDIRRRKNNKKSILADDKENQHCEKLESNNHVETVAPETNEENVVEVVTRALDAEKKVATSEKRITDLLSRVKDLESKLADNERRFTKTKEEEVSRSLLAQAKSLNDSHSKAVRQIETQLNDMRRKCEEVSQDKLILQGEVAENARRKIALEKDMEKMHNSVAERERQVLQLSSEVQELRRLMTERDGEIGRLQNSRAHIQQSADCAVAYEALLRDLHHFLPDFNPGSPSGLADSLRQFATKHVEQARKRTESEAERTQATYKQKLSETEAELNRLRRDHGMAASESEMLRKEVEESKRLSIECMRSAEVEMTHWRQEVAKLNTELINEREKLSEAESRLAKGIEEERRRLEMEWTSRISKMENDGHGRAAHVESMLGEKEKQLAEAITSRNELQSRLSGVENALAEAKAHSVDKDGKLSELVREKERLSTEADGLRRQVERLSSEVDESKHGVTRISSEKEDLQHRITSLESTLAEVRSKLTHEESSSHAEKDHLSEQLENLKKNLERFEADLAEERQNSEKLTAARDELSARLAAMESAAHDEKQREQESYEAVVVELRNNLEQLKTAMEQEKASSEQLTNANSQLLQRVQSLEGAIEEANRRAQEKEVALSENDQVRTQQVSELRRSVDDLSSELAGEKSKAQQTLEARDLLEKTAAVLETQLRELESNLNETKSMYSSEVAQLRTRLEELTNELNEERQTVAKLRSENNSMENGAAGKTSKMSNGDNNHVLTENGNNGDSSLSDDQVTYLRDELTKSKLANSHAEEALLALQEELNVAMAKVLKMESEHNELHSLIRTGEEALKSEQARSEDLLRKVASLSSNPEAITA